MPEPAPAIAPPADELTNPSPAGAAHSALRSTARPPADGVAVTLSGGGFRAMLFHLGFLWRFRDAGLLGRIDRMGSVSGGSITAGMLAVAWNHLDLNDQGESFRELVAQPILKLAGERVDILAGTLGRVPYLSGKWTRGIYDEFLYKFARMADLPKRPRFVFNATSMHSGKLVRINRDYIADWTTGSWSIGDLGVADAVAASSAFPPVLSPVVFELEDRTFTPFKQDEDSGRTPYPPPEQLFLTDGGVYDNLGIESVWKQCRTVYVSDAGAAFNYSPEGHYTMVRQALQVTSIMQDQIGALRFRQILNAFDAPAGSAERREGFMVSSDYLIKPPPAESPAFDPDHARRLAATPTRLTHLDPREARALVNWGYIATDHRIRSAGHLPVGQCSLPYPDCPV